MKISKKLLLLLYIALIVPLLVGCSFFDFSNFTTSSTQQFSTTLPVTNNGTITYSDSNYDTFPTYTSPTYSLSVADYNQVLYDTKELIRHANVQIETNKYEERRNPWLNTVEKVLVGTTYGSGFVFREDDTYFYVLTNYHVVNPEGYTAEYSIKTFSDTDMQDATLLAYDESLDLAVVQFAKASRTDVTEINIYNRLNYKFNPGELVMAVGNPQELANNVTFGQFISMENIANVDFKVIYHDASIHEGSSGGALVDVDGNLLGINTWGANDSDEYSFSIPNYIVYQFLVNNGMLD